ELRALVGLVLQRDARRDGLQALEPRGRLEMRTLLAAVQLGIALRTIPREGNPLRQGRAAIETTRRRHVLHQPRQPRAGDVDGRPGAWRLRPVLAKGIGIALRIHVPMLSVLAIAIHWG